MHSIALQWQIITYYLYNFSIVSLLFSETIDTREVLKQTTCQSQTIIYMQSELHYDVQHMADITRTWAKVFPRCLGAGPW